MTPRLAVMSAAAATDADGRPEQEDDDEENEIALCMSSGAVQGLRNRIKKDLHSEKRKRGPGNSIKIEE